MFGRDLLYQQDSADLMFVGSSSQVYRLNLEQGRFLNSYSTSSPALNCVTSMPSTSLVVVGGVDGKVEAWDPRDRTRAGQLDVAMNCLTGDQVSSVPAVTCITARDSLNLAVGTSTGQVLLYDIRASKPVVVKDHMYGLPIKRVVDTAGEDRAMVMSMDSQVVRIWDRSNGRPYTSIESTAEFNDLVLYPNSGLLMLANEQPRMQVFYVPSLGPAPRWASFLDSLTEELEESRTATVYDDYKFVTLADLQELGLDHLVGSPLLRAHLHGYFMDVRLYRKASSARPANSLENMKRNLIKKQIEAQREGRVKIEKKVPKVNQDLFIKLKVDEKEKKKKKKNAGDLLNDDRFSALFSDERFEVDKEDDAFKLIQPVVSKLDQDKKKEFESKYAVRSDEEEERADGDSDIDLDDSEVESSDDDVEYSNSLKREQKNVKPEQTNKRRNQNFNKEEQKMSEKITRVSKHKLTEVDDDDFVSLAGKKSRQKRSKQSLESRLEAQSEEGELVRQDTGHVMTFAPEISKQKQRREQEERRHRDERRELRRSAKSLKKDKLPPRFWMGKRVR